MPRITTPQSHHYLKKEYRSRFFSILFWLMSLALLFTTVFLLPSYLLLNFYQNSYQTTEHQDSQAQIKNINEGYAVKLEEVYQLSRKININQLNYMSAVETLNRYAGESIVFDAFELSSLNNKDITISLRGLARTREQLLAFEKRIIEDGRFEGFKIPIEVLTKQEDLYFNITFTYNEK